MNLSSIRVGASPLSASPAWSWSSTYSSAPPGCPSPAPPRRKSANSSRRRHRPHRVHRLAPIAWILLPVFAAGVAAASRRRSLGQGDAWPLVGLGAAIMQNCLFGGVVATQAVLNAGGLSADVEWGIWQLHTALFSLNAVSLAIIMASLSLAGVRTGLIRPWHATLGFVSAGVMTVVSVTTPLPWTAARSGCSAGRLPRLGRLAGGVRRRAAPCGDRHRRGPAATEPVAVNA